LTTLDKLKPGQRARVHAVRGTEGTIYQRLLEMGLFEGVEVEVVRFAPLGDPMEISLHGYNLSVRKSEANSVDVEVIS